MLVASIIGAIAVFSILIPTLAKTFEFKPRVYVGLVGKYTLDTLPEEITSLISIGLTKIEDDGSTKPSLAERVSIEEDGQAYRFVLKKGLKWQDGKALEPSDVSLPLKDTQVIATKNDIVFKLPAPFAPFQAVVAQPLLRKYRRQHRIFFSRDHLVGLGQAILSDYTLKSNHLSQISLDSPNERRIFRFYLSEEQLILAFKRGEVDLVDNLHSTYGLENWQNIKLEKTVRHNQYLGLFFDNRNPLFSKNVRQALSYATHKPEDDTRAIGPINPDSWAYLVGGKTYNFDQTRAIERIISDLPQQPLVFSLTTTTEFQAEAEKIKVDWETFFQAAKNACNANQEIKEKSICDNLNAQINLKVTNFPDLNNYETLLIGQEIPSDPDQYQLWHSDQLSNFTHYKNTRIDSLLERGRTTIDQTERKEIYEEFQQFFLEDAPAIFIRHLESYRVSR